MDKYRKIEWNKDRKMIKEINEKYNNKENPKPENLKNPTYKEKSLPKETQNFYRKHKIFIQVFFAIIAASTVIGIWNKYLEYLELKELEKQLAIDNERTKAQIKQLELEGKKMMDAAMRPFKEIENKRKSIHSNKIRSPKIDQQAQCKPAKINGVWQQHCE
ncbi:MAG: hypothetical protein KGZ58_06065 [Ignavibacteriales bacterium]|nr:hypothetical protein [Ignavibacteriales bacterium]